MITGLFPRNELKSLEQFSSSLHSLAGKASPPVSVLREQQVTEKFHFDYIPVSSLFGTLVTCVFPIKFLIVFLSVGVPNVILAFL